jgi:RNA-directed DNA polymerase
MRTCWVLKCDIKKFFASIDHEILKKLIRKNLCGDVCSKADIFWLLDEIIDSFNEKGQVGRGLPLGNLTSQLLVNIYMNEFDQFAKRELKAKNCIRYADDFVILHEDRKYLENILPKISEFLESNLNLALHPKKVSIETFASGVDFLGWVNFPQHRTLRTSTKRRMMRNLEKNFNDSMASSYVGLLKHGNTYKIKNDIMGKIKN